MERYHGAGLNKLTACEAWPLVIFADSSGDGSFDAPEGVVSEWRSNSTPSEYRALGTAGIAYALA
jgi:hypothetical protein